MESPRPPPLRSHPPVHHAYINTPERLQTYALTARTPCTAHESREYLMRDRHTPLPHGHVSAFHGQVGGRFPCHYLIVVCAHHHDKPIFPSISLRTIHGKMYVVEYQRINTCNDRYFSPYMGYGKTRFSYPYKGKILIHRSFDAVI